jgi:hypothetical protein
MAAFDSSTHHVWNNDTSSPPSCALCTNIWKQIDIWGQGKHASMFSFGPGDLTDSCPMCCFLQVSYVPSSFA